MYACVTVCCRGVIYCRADYQLSTFPAFASFMLYTELQQFCAGEFAPQDAKTADGFEVCPSPSGS